MIATVKSNNWSCDHCGRLLNHGEFRFNCVVCEDYDLCETCLATLNPPHPHRLMRELAYRREDVAKNYASDNMASNIQIAATIYSDRYCMGVRDVDKTDSSLYTDTYSWLTYETVGIRFRNFGNGLRDMIEPRGYLGICAGNRPEWVITDFACIVQSIVSVPIYCLFNDRELAYIINNTKVSVVVCNRQMLSRFIGFYAQCPSLRHIVSMDPIPEPILGIKYDGLNIHYMGDIEICGSNKQYDLVSINPDDCLTIVYTSGSSGFPKGAMLSDKVYRAIFSKWCYPTVYDLINFCYEPLAWATGRDSVIKNFLLGGCTGFSTGDVSRLMEDLALVRPNTFAATPTIWNKIYAEFKAALSLATVNLPPEAIVTEEDRLLKQFSQIIPTRCKFINTGGAKISPVVLDFLKGCFSRCVIHESYGTTECGSIACNSIIDGSLQFRLISVPEMGYTIDGELFPRGELLIKTEEMFSGYFNNPEETEAAFTEDGFFRTGDIVELSVCGKGQLRIDIIDRKKSFFKLSQGQYVSPEFLQNIYIQSSFVEQIYIHGDLLADSVAAVVVPNREYTQSFVLEHTLENFDMTNPDPKFYTAVLQDLRLLAEKESLQKHEIPSRLVIDFEPFTAENGLLTSTMKPCRHKLAAYYSERLKQSLTIKQRLKTIIESTTEQSLPTDEANNDFIPTGGDSLTAVRLSRQIESDLEIYVPISILLKPDLTLQQLTTIIEDPSKISSMSHSNVTQLLNDCQLNLNITVGGRKTTAASPSTIFITGITGFVGAFLLAELLLTQPSRCKAICLVRCEDSMDLMDRIRQNMLFYKIWREEFQERILALQGDLAKPCFGLDHETYQSLADQIDIIFHCGAVVNFVLPYSKLYESNVGGTREIIRLAAHKSTCIPIHYISTSSVLSTDVHTEVSIDEISPDTLATGYAQSKWVAEKLITKASHLGLPVVIYRLGSICASTETGACNRNDLHTLLFAAMMKMNYYPESLANARLRGLPVDFTAKSIVYLSLVQSNVYGKIYHVVNPNNDILFADIIDSICSCNIQLQSISLEEWRTRLMTSNDRDDLVGLVADFIDENSFKERCDISTEQYSTSISVLNFPPLNHMYLIKWLTFIRDTIVRR